VTSRDSDGNTSTRTETYHQWHTIEQEQRNLPEIEVIDESGSVTVRLEGADVVERELFEDTFTREREGGFFSRMFDNATGRYRETEAGVALGDRLFVVGEASFDEERRIPVIARDVLASTRSEQSHTRWLGFGVVASALLAAALTTASVALALEPDEPATPRAWLPGLAVVVIAAVLWWAVSTYNRLRVVAQGVDRAWSLIDVQLRRRHDLVPALAKVVAAHAAYEQEVLAGTVAARAADMNAEGARQTGELRRLLALAEATPELVAQESFLSLQRAIADTEARIAGSRTFFNNSLTLLRDRQRRFPSSLVAARVPLRHRDLIEADGFERTVPPIERSFDGVAARVER
jgi:LemA protein